MRRRLLRFVPCGGRKMENTSASMMQELRHASQAALIGSACKWVHELEASWTNHSANGIVVRREVQDVWEAFFAGEERILREDNK